MNSVVALDQNLGYVNCNICGEGYNSLVVRLFEDDSFTVTRSSKCYGNLTEEFVDAIFLREWLHREAWFLVATKYAREMMTSFEKDLADGKFTYANVTGQNDAEAVWFDEAVDVVEDAVTVAVGANDFTTFNLAPVVTVHSESWRNDRNATPPPSLDYTYHWCDSCNQWEEQY